MIQDLKNWTNSLVNKKFAEDKLARFQQQKDAAGNNRQDMSRLVLEDLLNEGYQTVQWDSGMSTHAQCLELNNQQWTLDDFLSGTEYDAPIFSRSHPGDKNCSLIISGENLLPVKVDSYGTVEEA